MSWLTFLKCLGHQNYKGRQNSLDSRAISSDWFHIKYNAPVIYIHRPAPLHGERCGVAWLMCGAMIFWMSPECRKKYRILISRQNSGNYRYLIRFYIYPILIFHCERVGWRGGGGGGAEKSWAFTIQLSPQWSVFSRAVTGGGGGGGWRGGGSHCTRYSPWCVGVDTNDWCIRGAILQKNKRTRNVNLNSTITRYSPAGTWRLYIRGKKKLRIFVCTVK